MRFSKLIWFAVALAWGSAELAVAQKRIPAVAPVESLGAALPSEDWARVQGSVDKALAWLASQQADDGSFPSLPTGQPAITSLAVLAFLSRGHQPGIGPYGQQLNRAIDFVLSCQLANGLLSYGEPEPVFNSGGPSYTSSYNHPIAGLMLGEVFGHVTGERSMNVKRTVQKALQFTRDLQNRPKKYSNDRGGWRYLRLRPAPGDADSDLSTTGWQLMFLRSARNAEFKVPQSCIDEAMEYVRRCWDENEGMFHYEISADAQRVYTRGLMGSAILSLSLGGQHGTPQALAAGEWLLKRPFRDFGDHVGQFDRFFYSTYYCSQAAAQLGGRFWNGIFPPIARALLGAQRENGSFPREIRGDGSFGQCYSTAMAVLSLTPAYQILPVYQR